MKRAFRLGTALESASKVWAKTPGKSPPNRKVWRKTPGKTRPNQGSGKIGEAQIGRLKQAKKNGRQEWGRAVRRAQEGNGPRTGQTTRAETRTVPTPLETGRGLAPYAFLAVPNLRLGHLWPIQRTRDFHTYGSRAAVARLCSPNLLPNVIVN